MRRGTTPTNVFDTDIDLSSATALYITYSQDGRTVVEKTLGDVDLSEENKISLKLTQKDTLGFADGKKIQIQIRAVMADGSAVASNIITTDVNGILKEGEI